MVFTEILVQSWNFMTQTAFLGMWLVYMILDVLAPVKFCEGVMGAWEDNSFLGLGSNER